MGDYENENKLTDVTENNATSEISSQNAVDSTAEINQEPISTSDQTIPNNISNNFNAQNEVIENVHPSSAPLVLGILSFLGILIPLAGYVLSICGIVISVKDKKKTNSKYGNTGLVLSIIALVLSFIMHVINIMILSNAIR